jgi:hypothetical protein
MILIAKILGFLLLLLWLFFIFAARMLMRSQGQIMHVSIFQITILPIIVGLGLIISGNLWFIVLLPVAYVLSIFFPSFFIFLLPLIVGWILGFRVLSDFIPNSGGWRWGGGVIGVALMFFLTNLIIWIVTRAPQGFTLYYSHPGKWSLFKS